MIRPAPTLLLVLAIGAVLYAGLVFAVHQVIPLRFHITIEQKGQNTAQVYWDLGEGYSEEETERSSVLEPGIHELEFVVPLEVVALRLDPRSGVGPVRIHAMRLSHVLDVAEWGGARGFPDWTADNDIGRFGIDDGALAIEASGVDPYFSNPTVWRDVSGTLMIEKLVGGAVITLIMLFVWLLVLGEKRVVSLKGSRGLLQNLGLSLASLAMTGGFVYLLYVYVLKKTEPQYIETSAYSICFLNRDGKRLSARDGNLALVLDPFTFYANYPRQRTENFYIDENGFRGGIADPNKPRVLIFGGSAAFGHGLDRDDQLMTAFLNKAMPSHTFINAAVLGFVSGQECAHMIHHLDRFRPVTYVLVDGWNDVAEQFDQYNYLGVNREYLNFSERLHQYNLLTDKSGIATEPFPVERVDPSKKNDLDKISRTYFDNLEKMKTWAQARDARFLVLFQPELTRRNDPTEDERAIGGHDVLSSQYKALVDRTLPFCHEKGIECHDANLQPEFQENPQTLFLDVVHMSAAGHEVVGRIIERVLQESSTPAADGG